VTQRLDADADAWRFDELRTLYVNCTLKPSPERSHTDGLLDRSRAIMERHGVAVGVLRAIDHDIATGVWPDMTEHGWARDDWPASTSRSWTPTSWCCAGRSGWATTAR
jgi:hypothetical protein